VECGVNTLMGGNTLRCPSTAKVLTGTAKVLTGTAEVLTSTAKVLTSTAKVLIELIPAS